MTATFYRHLLAIGACGLALVGCSAVPVAVARAGLTVDGGAGTSCSTIEDCEDIAYCSKASCDATEGTCVQRPLVCPDTLEPSCGCDGVNYWNDCLREREGVPASTAEECTTDFKSCDDSAPCSGEAVCARLTFPEGEPGGPPPCDPRTAGVCWVLPDACPDGGAPEWHQCGGPPGCLDFCAAVLWGLAIHAGPGMCR